MNCIFLLKRKLKLPCSLSFRRLWIYNCSIALQCSLYLSPFRYTTFPHFTAPRCITLLSNHSVLPVGSQAGSASVDIVCGISSICTITVCLVCFSRTGHRGSRVILLCFSFKWHQCSSHQRLLLLLFSEAQINCITCVGMDPYHGLLKLFKCRFLREADVGKRTAHLDRGSEEAVFTT